MEIIQKKVHEKSMKIKDQKGNQHSICSKISMVYKWECKVEEF